jgi:7-cyano-7-deazaguanine synthase
MKALVLMSGGLDSTTVIGYAKSQGYEIVGLSFDYGQKHKIEMESSKQIANFFGITRIVFKIDLTQIGGSSLTSDQIVEEGNLSKMGIPNTYVPGRNIIFLSIAGAFADVYHMDSIFIGVNSIDYSGYPDCRPDFISSMDKTLNLGLASGINKRIKIIAPLQELTKGEIIKMGINLQVPYNLTYSCYNGGNESCGKCDSCLFRLRGFMEAGQKDPIKYSHLPQFYQEYLHKK